MHELRIAVVFLAWVGVPCPVFAADPSSAREALELCKQSQLVTNTIAFNCTTVSSQSTTENRTSSVRAFDSEVSFAFIRNENRLDLKFKLRTATLSLENRLTFDERYKVLYSVGGNGGIVWQKNRDKEFHEILCSAPYAGWLDGYVGTGGKQRMVDLLLASADLRVEDSAAGELIQIVGTTPYGIATLGIDPDHGYVAVTAKVVKTATDRLNSNATVADSFLDPESKAPGTEWILEVNDVVVEEIDGHWIPIAGVLAVRQKYVGAEIFSAHVATRSDIRLHPKFDSNTFETDLPVDSYVNYVDDSGSGVSYYWDGSQPVARAAEPPPAIDQSD